MSIADYSDLLGQCAEYTGQDNFAHMFPRFVSYCESKLNRALRVGNMEAMAIVTTDADGASELPTDVLEIREVSDTTGVPLRQQSIQHLDYQYRFTSGTPEAYTMIGNTLYVVPIADAQDFTVTYYAKITPLTASNTTNWLLEDAPLCYLYGVSAEIIGWALASGKMEDANRLQLATAALQREVDSYQALDRSRRRSNFQIVPRGVKP